MFTYPRELMPTSFVTLFETYCYRIDLFKYSFFPFSIVEGNEISENLRKAKSFLVVRNYIMKF